MSKWFPTLLAASFLTVPLLAQDQEDQERGRKFEKRDKNRDGKISREEAGENLRAFNRNDKDGDGLITRKEFGLPESPGPEDVEYTEEEHRLLRGDGVDAKSGQAPAIEIPEVLCSVKSIQAKTSDGRVATAVYRVPPGEGPFPAIVFIHGGFGQWSAENLRSSVTTGPTPTRFLAKGYVVVQATFRSYIRNPQDEGPILDSLAIIDHVKNLKEVDTHSVVVMGGSGGGTILLDVIAKIDFCVAIPCEPASVVFAGLLEGDASNRTARYKSIYDPKKYYTPEKEKFTRAKIRKFNTPILMIHGDQHPLKAVNFDILVPAINDEKKPIEVKLYKGMNHGFYWGKGELTAEFMDQVAGDIHGFCLKHLKTVPKPINAK